MRRRKKWIEHLVWVEWVLADILVSAWDTAEDFLVMEWEWDMEDFLVTDTDMAAFTEVIHIIMDSECTMECTKDRIMGTVSDIVIGNGNEIVFLA
jgi:hypothetical protein